MREYLNIQMRHLNIWLLKKMKQEKILYRNTNENTIPKITNEARSDLEG